MTDFNTLDFSLENKVATITLNRPDAANGLNPQLALELYQAAQICDYNPDIRAVILTGKGRFFCAGGDIKHMASQIETIDHGIKILADNLHNAISTFAHMSAPVITAINGTAAGAGFSLAVTGDYVIAADTARLTMAYTKAGLSPDGSSSYYLPRLIGLRRTQDLMFTNRVLDAQEALDWGLISEVTAPDALMARAQTLASELSQGATGSHQAIKKLLLCSFDNSLETQMELEGRFISANAGSPNGREGITAFTEKRTPDFK